MKRNGKNNEIAYNEEEDKDMIAFMCNYIHMCLETFLGMPVLVKEVKTWLVFVRGSK